MRIELVDGLDELGRVELAGTTAVVIDAVRASSTIIQALASGALSVRPVATVEEALAAGRAEPGTLICGERRGLAPPGFDLGNSPREYTPERVKGRRIVLTTTNGAQAILGASQAQEVLIAAFLNLPAVVDAIRLQPRDVVIIAAGVGGKPTLDDNVCAGMLVEQLMRVVAQVTLSKSALASRRLYERHADNLLGMLYQSESGKALLPAGLEPDLPYVARVGAHEAVPRLRGEVLVA